MENGSIFRKWDLHVHTPSSFEHAFHKSEDEGSLDIWDKYIDELEKVEDISVLGITDYFSIEGYKKIIDYKSKGRLSNFDLILPNIEFRLNTFVEKRLNYHVIFSDKIDTNIIEREFLSDIHIKNESSEDRTLSRDNIEDIGKTLKNQHLNFKHDTDYYIGCMNITCLLEEILKILTNKRSFFEGKYLLVLPEEGWSDIGWSGQGHLTKKQLFNQSNALFSSNAGTREFALGKKEIDGVDFKKEFGAPKPCIHGSDAHSFDKLCKPDLDRFCWIKADPTFDGLKQIMYEPDERVVIGPDSPEHGKDIYTLASFRINNSKISNELEIAETNIALNSNLIAIIGGKGSGKTALLDLIANCFEDRCKRNVEDKNSFVQRIQDQNPELEIELTFLGNEVGNFTKKITDDSFFTYSRITYLPQGKIEEYSGDKGKIHEKIKEIIFNNEKVLESNQTELFYTLSREIESLEKEIRENNSKIFNMEKDITPAIFDEQKTRRELKKGELKNSKEILEKVAKPEEESSQKVEKLKDEKIKIESDKKKIDELEDELEHLKDTLSGTLENNEDIEKINTDLDEIGIDGEISLLGITIQLETIDAILISLSKKESEIKESLYKISLDLEDLNEVENEQMKYHNRIEQINSEIEAINATLEELKKKKEDVENLKEVRRQKFIELLKKYRDLKTTYKTIIDLFSDGKDKILSDIDFQANIETDKDKFTTQGDEILHGRKVPQEKISNLSSYLDKFMSVEIENIDELVGKYIEEIESLGKFLKQSRSNHDLYEWIYGGYYSLITDTLFNKLNMDKLSIGQKGTVLLMIFLAEGNNPLIIDQPEENLDNKFVYEVLVGSFREAKKKRQIIIATHNANLVVNTDAEQIIVAEFQNNVISYKSGSIENPAKRKNIITLLEGGEEAFKKRELKYGI